MEERTVAGRYRLTDRIGAGGMGVVWRAEDTRLRRVVALKELLTRNGFDADVAKRAVREGRIAARLQHPNVIALYDVVEDHDRPWLVMEYLPSRSLASILDERGALEHEEVRRIGRQLAAGLASAHAAGVVHRDVKPGNVLVTEFGTVKVTDFGTSRVAGEGTLTGSGLLVGTPAYLAPEVARGGEIGFPADVFGVGATLYAALEGAPPFGLDSNPIVLLHRAAGGEYPEPANAGPLTPVLARLLDPDPAARPTMDEAARMLAEGSADPATVLAEALPAVAATRVVRPAPVAEPEVAEPETGEPEVTEPEVTEPEATEPEATESEPPAAAEPVPVVEPVAPEPPVRAVEVPPVAQPVVPGGDEEAFKRRRLALAAVALVAVVAVVVAVLVNRRTEDTAGQNTGSATTTAETTSEQSPPAEPPATPPQEPTSTTGTTTTTTTTTPVPEPVGPDRALVDYYALLPGDTQAAYARLTDGFKAVRAPTFADFQRYWGAKQGVRVSEVSADGEVVTATITSIERNGSPITERHRYRMVRAGDGWMIDRQDAVG